jgi:phosphoglycerol transferase MdoB-like AlkP superfamily enzyme
VALAPASARALPGAHWQLASHDTPATMPVGARVEVRVVLRNRGDVVWSEDRRDRLAYHWRGADGAVVQWDGERTLLPRPVAPGEAVELVAGVTAPGVAGSYYLQFEPVREQRRWWGPAAYSRDVVIPVEVVDQDLAWSRVAADAPPALRPGERVRVRVVVRNDGGSPWSPAAGDRLGHRLVDREGRVREGARTQLPGPVAPGAEVELAAEVVAPDEPGAYDLVWEPVRERVRWYGAPRAGAAAATLTVLAGEGRRLTVDLPPLEVHADTPTEVPVIVRNLGDDLGDDHGLALSYHWRGPDGRVREFDGLRTPLPALAAGEELVVDARLRGPADEGPHRLEWALVREGVGWYPLDPPVDLPVAVGPPRLAWELLAADWPWTVGVGRVERVRVRVRNAGADTLSPDTGDRLAYRWRGPDGERLPEEGVRTPLPRPLRPGERVGVDLRVAGPAQPGPHTLELGLVREHVAWAGPPRRGLEPRREVRVVRRGALAQVALVALTLALLVRARRRRDPTLLRAGPALWTWAQTLAVTLTFADLAGLPLWPAGAALAASAAALPAMLVLAAPRRLAAALALLLSLGTGVLLLADLLYMQLLGSIVPVQALTASHQVGDIGASVAALLDPGHAWLLAGPLAGLLLALLWPAAPAGARARGLWVVLGLAAVPLAFALGLAMAGPLGSRVFSEQHNVGRFGVVGAHVFDGLRTARERLLRSALTPERRAEVLRWFAERPPPPPGAHAGVARGASLVLIQAEALQGWVVGARVGGHEVTPTLNRLARDHLVYPQLFDETAQGMTSDAEYAVLNSQLPLGQGAVAFLRADDEFVTLAHALRSAGYATLSAHPYKKGFWNRAVLHPRYGFDRSLFADDLGPGQVVGWGLGDEAFFRRMAPELAALPRPYFAFLVTLSLHHPYDSFPDALKELDLGALEGSALGNYLHGVRHFDRALAGLLAGLGPDVVVAVYGDHDSRLPHTPEFLGLAAPLAQSPAWTPALPLQLDRVAAVVALPGGQVRGEVGAVGGHIDLAPTLLHYLGVPAPRSFVGRPLLPETPSGAGLAAFSDGSAIGGGRVFVAAGREISRSGSCFEHPSGGPLPRAACDELAARALELLQMSRTVVDHDLARTLAP